MNPTVQVLLCLQLMALALPAIAHVNGNEWRTMALKTMNKALDMKPNTNIAKNVIIYLGDGMGVSTVTAARYYKGQLEGKAPERTVLSFEKFSNVALSKTYNTDYFTPDSAATATAFLSGVKANSGTLGVDASVARFNCSAQEAGKVTSIFKWAQDAGKSLGIVTTTRVTHATPAAAYAHMANRYWEGDVDTKKDGVDGQCKDITQQLVYNLDLKVILGGGRRTFLMNTTADPQTGKIDKKHRQDGRDLIEEWKSLRSKGNKRAKYVWDKSQLDGIDPAKTDYLLGLFASGHMDYELDRNNSSTGQPSLSEMTRVAIQILKKNEKGFILLIEGGKIDLAHHDNQAKKALHEVVEFDKAVVTGVDMTSEKDTLHVVTADHSHVFSIGGYPKNGANILGKVVSQDPWDEPSDGMPKTILSYGNGPGGERANITNVDTTDKEYKFQTALEMEFETHAAEDVAVYANGPMAHLFYGVQEQSYIPYVMAYAACVDLDKKHCDKAPPVNNGVGTRSIYIVYTTLLSIFARILLLYAIVH